MKSLLLALIIALVSHAGAFYEGTDVQSLTPANFDQKIKNGVWLVEFYAPWCGHCKNLTPEWIKAAKALKSIINVGAVDADAHRDLGGRYNVKGFPTIKLFYTSPSTGEIKSVDYQGGRSAKEIVEWTMTKAQKLAFNRLGIKSSSSSSSGDANTNSDKKNNGGFYGGTNVVTLTDANFHSEVSNSDDPWFIEFYAPWCGHCKALKPAWIEVAQNLDGRVKVGAVDCDTHKQTCSEFGVQGFPTLKFFGGDKKHRSGEDYSGERTSDALTAFASERWAREQPPPEAKELTDNDLFVEHCLGHEADPSIELKAVKPKQLCLLAFLPHILDSKASGRNEYLEMLKSVATSYKERPFAWFWAEGGSQSDLEGNFGVGGFGYPAFIAFNPTKNKYATLRGAFDRHSLKEFMDAVRTGREPVSDVSNSLASVATVAPWDGQDGAENLEEEFSLEDLGIGGDDDDGKGEKKEEL